MDRAVGYAVLAKIWQLLTGPVTQLLIVMKFSESLQAYYIAFGYLLGMQIFVELGLQVVLINISSHEWSRLSMTLGRIDGDPHSLSRLASLVRLMERWYSIAGAVFAVVIFVVGFLYLRDTALLKQSMTLTDPATSVATAIQWTVPWSVAVLLAAVQLRFVPLTAILEGCNQLSVIYRLRFLYGVIGTLVVWTLVLAGGGLWAVVASVGIRLAGDLDLVTVRFREFFRTLRHVVCEQRISWRNEVLPLQWRIAVQGILLWCVNGLPGLMVFRFYPDAEAVRLGMTWTILTALQSVALAWTEIRRPQFGMLIATGQYSRLDRLFYRLTWISVGLMALGVAAFLSVIWLVGSFDGWLFERISARLLPLPSAALLAAALLLLQFALCTNLYVRAHKRDPFLIPSIISGVSIVALELWFGRRLGANGVALGYFIGIALVQVPLWTWIWWRTRIEWHKPDPDRQHESDHTQETVS